MLRVHLLNFFGSYRLTDIDTNLIKAWFREMQRKKQFEGSKYEKPLNPKTINMAYRTLITMMEEAVDRKLITSNPTRKVSKLSTTDIDRVILNINEVRALFPANWNDIWDNWYTYKANRIAACTGMRIGELRGIRGIDVHSDYVCVHGQFTKFGYKDSTKNKHNRNVPINDELYQEFQELISVNHNGFLFSEDGGIEPIEAKKIEDAHNRALNKIGIDEVERKRRGLTFHAWRHFFNTLLKMADLADSKVMSVIGHLDKKSSEHYTHFDTTQFTEVRNAQTRLLSGPTPETPETESKKRGRPRKEKRAETGKPGRNEKQVKKPVKAAKADKTVKPSQAKKTAASRKTAKAAKAKKK
jgi:integrase